MEELVMEWLENHLLGDTLEEIITCVAEMLENSAVIRERIFREVEKEYHRIDVIDEFEIREIENYTDDDVEYVLYHYEEYLGDDDSWHIALDCAFEHLEED